MTHKARTVKSEDTPPVLRRYTSLPSLLHLLQNKKITLLSPSTWEDRNDAFFLSRYKELKGLKSVLALCFAESHERYHHWRVFTHGSAGVCIEFDREPFVAYSRTLKNVRAKKVTYKEIAELGQLAFSIDQLP